MNAYSNSQASDEGFKILCQNTTPTALYESTQPESTKSSGCLHGTRIGVQEHIFKWFNSAESEVAMWMYGPAGIGKTAIAQTVAKLCAEREQLSSAFFFFRSDEGRNSAKHLVPTLAFEMLQQMPHMRDTVCTPIVRNPLIFSASLERQIRMIVLSALAQPLPPSQDTLPHAKLLIVDGLDECIDTETQESIIRLFVSLLAATPTTIRHKLLMVSRPESRIVSAFSADDITPHVHHLCLDEWQSIADIEIFLRAELKAVKQTHPLKLYLDPRWPSEASLTQLLHKSFESFAYATSAIRYISSHDRHPGTSLNSLLSLSAGCAVKAHAELDSLYRHILESLDEQLRDIVLKVLCLYSCHFLENIEAFGCIVGEEPPTVELAVIRLSSVLRFDRRSRIFSYYHTSFSDFLLDEQRSGRLYLYSPRVATAVAEALMFPTTFQSMETLSTIGSLLSEMGSMGLDMQIHILKIFLAAPHDQLANYFVIGDPLHLIGLSRGIEHGSRATHPDELARLYCQAFKRLSALILSELTPCTLETILEICYLPAMKPLPHLTTRPHSWDIIYDLVRLSNDPWCTIHRLLSGEETWEICVALLRIYIAMPQGPRFADLKLRHFGAGSFTLFHRILSLTSMLIRMLQSEAARPEICYVLEGIVAEAVLTQLSGPMTAQDLISSRLCAPVPLTQELKDAYAPIAGPMDLYIRRTHSELSHLPYVSDDVKRLYSQ